MTLTHRTGGRSLTLVSAHEDDRAIGIVAGIFAAGYPWGDRPATSDLLLSLPGGRRFVAAGETLPGLTIDAKVGAGALAYRGDAWELAPGTYRAGVADLIAGTPPAGAVRVTIDLAATLRVAPLQGGVIEAPFSPLRQRLCDALGVARANEILGDDQAPPLGFTVDTGAITVEAGTLRVTGGGAGAAEATVDLAGLTGEAETVDLRALLRPLVATRRVTVPGATIVDCDVLDPGGGGLVDDAVAHTASAVLRRAATVAMTWTGDRATQTPLAGHGARHAVQPVVKLAWDHLGGGGVLERRLAWIEGGASRTLGLSETALMAAAYGAGSRVQTPSTVHVVKGTGDDPFPFLEKLLFRTGFDDVVSARAAELGVPIAELRVVVKPNFMFMYSTRDHSTYTNPKLVLYLVDRLRALGCRDITIVEAQSAYGNYFQGREVARVAEYVGYSTKDPRYRIADLTLEKEPFDYGGRTGMHVVGKTWRDAQMRISFAKNKTHTWSYYTLTIKNTYGALPMQDKLREYHYKRDIEYPTIDALRHWPVHFGLVDAWVSADGQFGIFADREPNDTKTFLGGTNILAIDWVGARKMGLDPMVSKYLREAAAAFGMPEIVWQGDRSVYDPWENVLAAMTEFWNRAEKHIGFTDAVLRTLQQMDGHFPPIPRPWWVRLLRFLFGWIGELIFKKPRPPELPPPGPPRPAKAN